MIGGSRVSSFHWKQSSMILTDEFMFSGEKISQHGLTSRFLKLFPDIEMDEMNLLLLPPAMARKAPNLNHSIIVVHGGRYSSRSMGPIIKLDQLLLGLTKSRDQRSLTFNWQVFFHLSWGRDLQECKHEFLDSFISNRLMDFFLDIYMPK